MKSKFSVCFKHYFYLMLKVSELFKTAYEILYKCDDLQRIFVNVIEIYFVLQ